MIVGVYVKGFENEVKKMTLKDERRNLRVVSSLMLNKVMENERDDIMMMLMGGFKRLRYEDLEEVYSDGCFVLWEKMVDKDFVLDGKGMVGYLRRVCWNIGMKYLRKVNDEIESLDKLMENGIEPCGGYGIGDMYDVLDEKEEDENKKLRKLEKVWEKLSVVDRMILECYYVEGCKMEEIAKRIGYKNGNSVKSKKKKVLMKIMEMRDRADIKDLPAAA